MDKYVYANVHSPCLDENLQIKNEYYQLLDHVLDVFSSYRYFCNSVRNVSAAWNASRRRF